MSSFDKYGRRDTELDLTSDESFRGVMSRTRPEDTPPGYVHFLENGLCESGRISTRRGYFEANLGGALGTVYATGNFSNPNGPLGQRDFLLVAVSDGVYAIQFPAYLRKIIFPDEETIDKQGTLLQLFNKIVLFRPGKQPLEWSGNFDDNFVLVDAEIPPAGLEATPQVGRAIYYRNRVWAVVDDDRFTVSGAYQYAYYEEQFGEFYANEGSDDFMQMLVPFNKTSLIVFKDQSIFHLKNIYFFPGNVINHATPAGTITTNLAAVVLDEVTDEYGLIAWRAAQRIGPQIVFPGERGIYKLVQSEEGDKVVVPEIPFSYDIEDRWDRVSFSYVELCCSGYHDNLYFLAAPFEGATAPNRMFVYSTIQQAWQGEWTIPSGLFVHSFAKADYYDRKRLYWISTDGRVFLMNEGPEDVIAGVATDIVLDCKGRGLYKRERRQRLYAGVHTHYDAWASKVTVSVLYPGYAEEQTVMTDETQDRARYLRSSKSDWTESNANNDFADPYRQDYSVKLPATGMELGDVPSDGVLLEEKQHFEHNRPLMREASLAQVRVQNKAGSIEITGMGVEIAAVPQSTGSED